MSKPSLDDRYVEYLKEYKLNNNIVSYIISLVGIIMAMIVLMIMNLNLRELDLLDLRNSHSVDVDPSGNVRTSNEVTTRM